MALDKALRAAQYTKKNFLPPRRLKFACDQV
jgi:hypothetical protein